MLVNSKGRCTGFVSVVGVVLLLHGCGYTIATPKNGAIAVDSEPSGATVYVMGKLQGDTPLAVQLQDVFPIVYAPDQQDLYGMVILKKDGCEDYLQRVSSAIMTNGVKAELDCTEVAAEQTPTQRTQGNQSDIPVSEPTSLKQRLIRLDELHQDGLITDEEYGAARRRILDEL